MRPALLATPIRRCRPGCSLRIPRTSSPTTQGRASGGVLAEAGLLRPLEDAYESKGWDIYEWARQRATYNGTIYGIPDQVEEIVVFYNKDLVSEVPETVDELRQIADELRGRGIIPFAFGDQEQWPAGHMFSIAVSNVLGREGLVTSSMQMVGGIPRR
jgi:raffinose/stachyose/melibiose transport system substrate-binding protein